LPGCGLLVPAARPRSLRPSARFAPA